MASRADLMNIDLDRISAALAGLLPSRPMTMKALIRSQLSHIEDARERGLTHDEIAKALTQEGCDVTAATLRKYLSQFQREGATTRPTLPHKTSGKQIRVSAEAPTSAPRRSLRRSTLISTESKP